MKEIARRMEGAVIIEYALVVPIFLLLVMGIIEYSLIMYSQAVLNGAMMDAARQAKTGYYNGNNGDNGIAGAACSNQATQSAYISCIVVQDVGGFLNSTTLSHNISATYYSSFGGSGTTCTTSSSCTESTTGSGSIVLYTVSYPWVVATPFLSKLLPNYQNGIVTISASALVKNENTSATNVPLLSQ